MKSVLLRACKYSAATPATCGEAMDVPHFVDVPPFGDSDRIPEPGAKMSTQLPQLDQTERWLLLLMEPTTNALSADAGEELQASSLLFPAATTTTTPESAAELIALFKAGLNPPPRLKFITMLRLGSALLIWAT
jgi:hypothetical protein